MALNLWKIGGKPTSYNPLPFGYQNIPINAGDYVFKCKAKSSLGGTFEITETGTDEFIQYFVLNSQFQDIVFTFSKKKSGEAFLIRDRFTTGDIIIEDIQLVQKPLPTLTINGIDGFNSGKWGLPSLVSRTDDEVTLNITSAFQTNWYSISASPNQTYTLSFKEEMASGQMVAVEAKRDNNTTISTPGSITSGKNTVTFTTPNETTKLWIITTGSTIGTYTFKRPMLNLGTTPAPYEPKRGERMVLPSVKGKNLVPTDVSAWEQGTIGTLYNDLVASLNRIRSLLVNYQIGKQYTISCANGFEILANPGTTNNTVFGNPITFTATGALGRIIVRKTDQSNLVPSDIVNAKPMLQEGTQPTAYEPYAVQLNKKPLRYVPNNLFNGWDNGYINSNSVDETLVSHATARTSKWIPCNSNTMYNISNVNRYNWQVKNSNGVISYLNGSNPITTLNDSVLMRVYYSADGTHNNVQIYNPNELILPRAKSGLAFNGTSDYLQLPSMTMDSIEIECLIDSLQPQANGYLFDARTGLADGFIADTTYAGGVGTDINNLFVNGNEVTKAWSSIPKGVRSKIKATAKNAFTSSVFVFSRYTAINKTKATLYKITAYLNNQVVAQYDFENPQNIVGDKVLPNAKNLIPSFEDSRWSLHANAKVYGKDVLRLEAIGTFQSSTINFDVKGGSVFKGTVSTNGYMHLSEYNKDGVKIKDNFNIQYPSTVVNLQSDTISVRLALGNNTIGTFDFIKPQLFELSDKEGTIVGRPSPQIKQARRLLYAKR